MYGPGAKAALVGQWVEASPACSVHASDLVSRPHAWMSPPAPGCYPQRDEVPEEVQVAAGEDERVQLLRLERDAATALGGVDLPEQHEERQEVQHVTGQPARSPRAREINRLDVGTPGHRCKSAEPVAGML